MRTRTRAREAAARLRGPRGWVLLFAVVFALLQLGTVTGRDTPDTKNYLSYALSLGGADKRETAAVTIDYACAGRAARARREHAVDVLRFRAPSPDARVAKECRDGLWRTVDARLRAGQRGGHTLPFMPVRFMRIFEVRPGYPVFLVPFVTVLGATWGLWAAGVTVTVAGGVLVYLLLRRRRVPVPLALTGQALYYVLPCGTTAMRPMTEGLMTALTLAALWGCALALDGRARLGPAVVAGALLALFTVKHSQALFLALCLAAAGALTALRRRARPGPARRAVTAVTAVACCAVAGTLLVARALHYPSEYDSLQDLLTGHYARPDRARPWSELLHLELSFWREWLRRQLWQPLFAALLAAGAWGALGARRGAGPGRERAFGAFVVAAACTGFLNQAAHPDITVWGERLIVLAWLLPVLGLPLLLDAPLPGARRPAAGIPGPRTRSAAGEERSPEGTVTR
ncbi:hypothetical protein ABZ719_25455 [Streptomyces sp. NPDC006743]|uniref:hypothetical protein n=1 Tax=Streptomyces sp. NPDC006743 TaxID=3154480 RepID=UPI0034552739